VTTSIDPPSPVVDTTDLITPDDFAVSMAALDSELRKLMVGQDDLLRDTLTALFAGGHVLLEGVPGLGKTALVRAIGDALDLHFSRVQFTPDLMPADILGTTVIQEGDGGRQFSFQPGPIFANLVLADEVNRATPKTQSALLEAMQERTVTTGTRTRALPDPFFVLATQNPIELEGTYPLPEAQLDRFVFKLLVPFPSETELAEIARRTTGRTLPTLEVVASADRVRAMVQLAAAVPIADHVIDYAVRLVTATHPDRTSIGEVKDAVRFGASPRAVQALVRGGKVRALMAGRYNVSFNDVRAIAKPALRHRIFLTFEAEAAGIDADKLVDLLLDAVVAEPVTS
jgi:MoxR-like ATPase